MPLLQVRDLQLYYELHGAGAPLVLLNGALDTIETDWGRHLPAFASHFRVLAFDHRGHGRTNNPTGSFQGYSGFADDLTALLDTLDIERACLCGFSDGAATALTFALRHPERVEAMVLVGARPNNDAQALRLLDAMTPERIMERFPHWAEQLDRLHNTRGGEGYWQKMMHQMAPFWRIGPNLALSELAHLTMPILLIAGERDGFGNLDQQLTMRRTFPNAQLCIAPNAGHFVMNDQPELFQLVVMDFLRQFAR
jgi:pimeloyl-ACP methyl ester carboxylesterase